ncbi:hypothetical protein E4U19_002838, partial [Claviceps sp. Clav32 group G5]
MRSSGCGSSDLTEKLKRLSNNRDRSSGGQPKLAASRVTAKLYDRGGLSAGPSGTMASSREPGAFGWMEGQRYLS